MKCPVCNEDLWIAGDSMAGGDYWTHVSVRPSLEPEKYDEQDEADKHIPKDLQSVGFSIAKEN